MGNNILVRRYVWTEFTAVVHSILLLIVFLWMSLKKILTERMVRMRIRK